MGAMFTLTEIFAAIVSILQICADCLQASVVEGGSKLFHILPLLCFIFHITLSSASDWETSCPWTLQCSRFMLMWLVHTLCFILFN